MTFDGDYKRILITPTKKDGGVSFFVRRSESSAEDGDTVAWLGNEHLLKLDDETFLKVMYCPMSFLETGKG